MGIKFNDQHIPDSPHKVYISPAMGDAHKLEVAQFPESGVQPDKPYTFLVRKNGAKGELDGKVNASALLPLVTSVIRCAVTSANVTPRDKSPCEREERSAVNNSRAYEIIRPRRWNRECIFTVHDLVYVAG